MIIERKRERERVVDFIFSKIYYYYMLIVSWMEYTIVIHFLRCCTCFNGSKCEYSIYTLNSIKFTLLRCWFCFLGFTSSICIRCKWKMCEILFIYKLKAQKCVGFLLHLCPGLLFLNSLQLTKCVDWYLLRGNHNYYCCVICPISICFWLHLIN